MSLTANTTTTSETPVDDHAGEPSAWLIRAGSPEHYDHNIDQGLAGIHFGFTQDLNTFASREDLKADTALKPSALGQLWRLRNEVQAGDLVVMPPNRASNRWLSASSPAATGTARTHGAATATSSRWIGSALVCHAAPSDRTCGTHWLPI